MIGMTHLRFASAHPRAACAAVAERLLSMHADPRWELDIPMNLAASYESVRAVLSH
jgi:hypothetical protein